MRLIAGQNTVNYSKLTPRGWSQAETIWNDKQGWLSAFVIWPLGNNHFVCDKYC